MKKLFTFIIIIILGNIAIAGNNNNPDNANTKLVSGKVIDKNSGEEIVGAEIKIDDKTIYTDLNGNFSAIINTTKSEAVVKFVSYNDAPISINPFSYSPIVVELESK